MNKVSVKHKDNPKIDRGQIYLHEDGEVCMLSQIDTDLWTLICLEDGNRYFEPFKKTAIPSMLKHFSLVTGTVTIEV